jgi:hypothetical protein
MEILKNKKILIGGLLLLGVVAYFYMDKKKKEKDALLSDTTGTGDNLEGTAKNNYAVSLDSAGVTGIYQILNGKKYPFSSERAYEKYGKPSIEVISQENLNLIPTGGFIGYEGQVVQE